MSPLCKAINTTKQRTEEIQRRADLGQWLLSKADFASAGDMCQCWRGITGIYWVQTWALLDILPAQNSPP